MGKWRYEVWPTVPQNDDLFLNVLEPTGSATPTMVANQRIDASSGNMVGALIQDPMNPYVVMFSKTESPQSSVTYDANYSSSLTGKHLLADMSPGTYDIYKNGAKILSGITASSQGSLYFESLGGSVLQIVKTGEAPPPLLKGDVQCDKAVDVLDVQALVNCILGTGNCDWGCGNSADANGDDSVDILDIQEVVNIILGG